MTDNENLVDEMKCGGQDEDGVFRPILCESSVNEGDWPSRPFHNHSRNTCSRLADKLIDSGQIIIAQKLLDRKNDIYVMMVSWEHCVISKDKYITIVITVTETAVVSLGFEYRSVHDGARKWDSQ